MKTEDYIASGVLEAYVLGELTEHEQLAVEQACAQYPEIKTALREAEDTQEQLLMRAAFQPQAAVKESLFAKINTDDTDKKLHTPSTTEKPRGAERQLITWRSAAAASISIAVISSFMAINYHSKWKNTESSLQGLLAQNQQMAQDYNTVNQRLDVIESQFNVTSSPDFKRVVMNGTAGAPDALASVYWNKNSHEVYLNVQNLKQLAQDKQYQLWAIVDGKPVDAGIFDNTKAGLLKMKAIQNASAFAVTIEPHGGSASPALETMQVVGNT